MNRAECAEDVIALQRQEMERLRAELAAERERAELHKFRVVALTEQSFKQSNAVAKLREALEPFAVYADAILSSVPDDCKICGYDEKYLYANDLRKARAVLKETGDD